MAESADRRTDDQRGDDGAPAGVLVLALVGWLVALIQILGALVAVFGGELGAALVLGVGSGGYAVVAWGLVVTRRWAWIGAYVLLGINALGGLLDGSLFALLVSTVVGIYLLAAREPFV